jgi:MFS family permease
MLLSCLIILVTHDTVGAVTIALVWLGHVTVTGAELFTSAGEWGLIAELSDQRRLGEYQGMAELGSTLGYVWAPALFTFLAMQWHALGWVLIAAIVLAAAVGIHPAARAARRSHDRTAETVTV